MANGFSSGGSKVSKFMTDALERKYFNFTKLKSMYIP